MTSDIQYDLRHDEDGTWRVVESVSGLTASRNGVPVEKLPTLQDALRIFGSLCGVQVEHPRPR